MPRISPLWLIALAFVMSQGCRPSSQSPTEGFGQFEGNVVASWDADGRNMTLQQPFAYIDAQGRRWAAPAGAVVNGASIPSAFWTLVGGPFEGKYRNASVVHDVGCEQMRQSWEDVHRMFYEACRCGGVEEMHAKTLYYAVYHFGPRWQAVTDVVVEQQVTETGAVVEREVAVQRMARIDPPPPTPEEIEQVAAYVAEENPAPEAIRRFSRDSLHRRHFHRDRPTPNNDDQRGPVSEHRDSPSWRAAPNFDRGEARPSSNGQGNQHARGQFNGRDDANLPAAAQQEQQWAIEHARRHIEQQAGEPRPAQYSVERTRGGFDVQVQFLQLDEQGQAAPYEGGTSTVRVSRHGQIVEVLSGN